MKQGQVIKVWIVYVDEFIEDIFTSKAQAEEYLSDLKEAFFAERYARYRIVERTTVPHETEMCN